MKLVIICSLGFLALAMAQEDNLLQRSNDQFTAKFFNEVIKNNPNKNVIVSAFSVLPPLAQLALASEGESHDELLNAVGLPDDSTIKEVFSGVSNRLGAVKGVELRMASRIYIAKDAELNPSFSELSRQIFQSDAKNIDFVENTVAAQEINQWVEDQTNKRIKDLVDPKSLNGDTRAMLVNAIYFKGSWKKPFKKDLTTEADFHVSAQETKKVPTMHITSTFRYGESAELDAKLLELLYDGGEATFLIVLPNKIDGLANLAEKLRDPSALSKAVQNMHTEEVNVALPKFKIETTTDLKDVLEKLNVTKLFEGGKARLEKLLKSDTNLFVSSAVQKAFIEVNEEGAEAAASNDFGISYLSAFVPETREFKADHPFVFYLKEEQSLLFSGAYAS